MIARQQNFSEEATRVVMVAASGSGATPFLPNMKPV
jgi:hypothetical protein